MADVTYTINTAADWVADIAAIDNASQYGSVPTHYIFDVAPTTGNSIVLNTTDPNFYTAPGALNLVTGDSLTINGNGNTLDGNSGFYGFSYTGLVVYAGAVTVNNLNIANFYAAGGESGSGGGGGAGLGGGLFVGAAATVTLSGVSFANNIVRGGSAFAGTIGGGGGGLDFGKGGNARSNRGFAGGGGGFGGSGGSDSGAGGDGLLLGAGPGGFGDLGQSGGLGGGGGGAGETDAGGGGVFGFSGAFTRPGNGGFGGGGGGSGSSNDLHGGDGGFGGGGGSAFKIGGSGGFGGGGATGLTGAGLGGFGGGNASIAPANGGGGGGGLAAGGDIFVQQGGSVIIADGSLGIGRVLGGSGINGGGSGRAFGNGLFIQGNQTVTLAPASGSTLSIAGQIADQTGSYQAAGLGTPTGTSAEGTPNAGSGSLLLNGAGTVLLSARNAYTGGTLLAAGMLELGAVGAGGSGAIQFGQDSTATLKIDGTVMPTNTIGGFATGETIDLAGVAYDAAGIAALISGNVLNVVEGGQTYSLNFDPQQSFAGQYFHLAAVGLGTNVTIDTVACYVGGTLILTAAGEREVETLAIGDRLVTACGDQRPVIWIGRRSYAGRFLRANPRVVPVRFRAGSLGGGLPRRDLLVSPEHAMFLDGLLVPARCLVNGSTVIRDHERACVDYFHIELDRHDVILAEGAASESFVDDDSRLMFHNAAEWEELYPGREAVPALRCAPRVEDGYALEAIRQRLGGFARGDARAA